MIIRGIDSRYHEAIPIGDNPPCIGVKSPYDIDDKYDILPSNNVILMSRLAEMVSTPLPLPPLQIVIHRLQFDIRTIKDVFD